MKSYLIQIQSFNDIVTNSSMEVYVKSDETTLSSIKEIIESIFAMTGYDRVLADDFFDIKLDKPGYWETTEFEDAMFEKLTELGLDWDDYHEMDDSKKLVIKKAVDTNFNPDDYYDCNYDQNYVISIKEGFEEEKTERVRKALSNLQNIFNLKAVNNY